MKWEEPPSLEPTKDHTPPEWVAELMAHPKRWALVMEGLTSSASNYYQREINLGYWHKLPPDTKWEATRRKKDGGTFAVYARFIK